MIDSVIITFFGIKYLWNQYYYNQICEEPIQIFLSLETNFHLFYVILYSLFYLPLFAKITNEIPTNLLDFSSDRIRRITVILYTYAIISFFTFYYKSPFYYFFFGTY